MAEINIGPKVDRIESNSEMAWPSNEGRLNAIEEEIFDGHNSNGGSNNEPANP